MKIANFQVFKAALQMPLSGATNNGKNTNEIIKWYYKINDELKKYPEYTDSKTISDIDTQANWDIYDDM